MSKWYKSNELTQASEYEKKLLLEASLELSTDEVTDAVVVSVVAEVEIPDDEVPEVLLLQIYKLRF